ncbi:MAG TPA: hypothetical protein VEG84_06585, partial [Thermoanaerobaculia bacterium]|nr:hypothetical protein [Thermoanaerobaculia bacterium]
FRFRKSGRNIFKRRNRIVALPATLVAQRFEGDAYHRLDRVTFRIRNLDAMAVFSKQLSSMLKANHRQQDDFRLDDVAARVKKEQSQGDVYDLIFLLSGTLSLLGGGIVNVNIQMATLKERVREVGVKMAIGAPGGEIFREFLTEAMLLTGLEPRGPRDRRRVLEGDHDGARRSALHGSEELPLGVRARRGVRIPLRPLPRFQGEPPVAHGGAAL